MIVKVQTNLNPPAGQRVLIYNRSRSVQFEGDTTPQLLTLMRGRPLAFFAARMNGTAIDLQKMVKDREW